jgi:hypothetical protein
MTPALILQGLFRWIGWPGIVGICVWLFFTGVPLLGWWPFSLVFEGVPVIGYVIEGEIARRIEAHDAERDRLAALRMKRAAEELARRHAERLAELQKQGERDAQSRVNLATGEADERERFLIAGRLEREERIRQLQQVLSDRSDNQDTCEPEVVTRHVEKLVPQACGYPGDARPSTSFLREYRKLKP